MQRIALTALVLVLLGGTTAAFALTQALKLERAPVLSPRFDRVFSPTCDCVTSRANLSVVLREADAVDAAIVDRHGDRVRVLADGLERARGRVNFSWDGRDEEGRVVPDGLYRLRVHVDRQRRTIVIPTPIRVDTRPPVVAVVAVEHEVFSPDGDGRNDRTVVVYRTREPAEPVLFVNGNEEARGAFRHRGRHPVPWDGQIADRPAEPGRYRLAIAVRDKAGNLSRPVAAGTVRVRYVGFAGRVVRAVARGIMRFRVEADAEIVRWTVVNARGRVVLRGRAEPGPVGARLPDAVRPGRYVLRATANGRRAEARLVVERFTMGRLRT